MSFVILEGQQHFDTFTFTKCVPSARSNIPCKDKLYTQYSCHIYQPTIQKTSRNTNRGQYENVKVHTVEHECVAIKNVTQSVFLVFTRY